MGLKQDIAVMAVASSFAAVAAYYMTMRESAKTRRVIKNQVEGLRLDVEAHIYGGFGEKAGRKITGEHPQYHDAAE